MVVKSPVPIVARTGKNHMTYIGGILPGPTAMFAMTEPTAATSVHGSSLTIIEIGRKDISEKNNLPMRPFTRGATFVALQTSIMAKDDPPLASRTIEGIVQEQVKGLYRPVGPIRVMPIQEVEEAFRMLQDGQMIGKIILKITDDSVIPVSSPYHH
jgi:hypothetical protein